MLRRSQVDVPKTAFEGHESAYRDLAEQAELLKTQLIFLVNRVSELRGAVDGLSVLLNYIVPLLVCRNALDRDVTLDHLRDFISDGQSFLGGGPYAKGVISEYFKMERNIKGRRAIEGS